MTMVMTLVTNRQIERSALKARIYEAAISEFRRNGYSDTTVEAITKRARVAKGTFFNFYRTKTDVLTEYYSSIDERIAPHRSKIDPSKPYDSLVLYAKAVERELNKEGPLAVDMIIELMRNDTMSAIDTQSGDHDAAEFTRFFQRARAMGTIAKHAEPSLATAAFMDLWAGSVRDWVRGHRATSLSERFAKKLFVLFQGLGARESL